MICRGDTVTGSRLSHKTCHSKEEWAAIRLDEDRQRDELQLKQTNGKIDAYQSTH